MPTDAITTLHSDRTRQRKDAALAAAGRVLDATRAAGLDVVLIGSLARGGFLLHSDVDFFVRGATDTTSRIAMERAAAEAFRGSGIPYDIIYASDLTEERAMEFLGA